MKPDIKVLSGLMFRNDLCMPYTSCGPLAKKPHLETRLERHQGSRNSSGHMSGVFINSRKKVSQEGWHS